jgi:hypothetical protein
MIYKRYLTCEISGSHDGEYVGMLWDVAPCSHIKVDRHFRGAYYLHHQGDQRSWSVYRTVL